MAEEITAVQTKLPRHPYLIAVVASLAAFMEVLDTTITNVSLTHIAGSLGSSQNESTWVLTSYLVANGIVLPLSGWLADVLGRKIFFLSCIIGFTLASLACGMATSLEMLIVFRLLQGIAGGGLQPMQQAIVMDSFPPHKRGVAFAITGITIVVAPILGPTLGGYITDNFSWRWIFFINIPVGILAALLVQALVKDPPHAEGTGIKHIDFIGLGLLALGLGALQVVLDKGQDEDWFGSPFIVWFSILSASCLVGGVFWLLRQKDPIVDLRLLKDKYFGPSCLMIFFIGFILYGATTLLPLLLQSVFGYSATLSGLVLSPGSIVVIIGMAVVGKLVTRVQPKYLIALGMFFSCVGMIATMRYTPQTDFTTFVLMRTLQVASLPFLFVPIGTLAFGTVPKELSNKASALFNLMRNLGGSFGISLTLTYLARRAQMHQTFLAENLGATDVLYQNAVSFLSRTLESMGVPLADAQAAAVGRLYGHMVRQAMVLGYADAFQLFALISVVLALFAFALPRSDLHKKSGDDAVMMH